MTLTLLKIVRTRRGSTTSDEVTNQTVTTEETIVRYYPYALGIGLIALGVAIWWT